jgi:pimeloyl-ACP methyl ester carboxylesterase
LTQINSKPIYYKASGNPSGPPVIFVHGLGGSAEFFTPLIQCLGLDKSCSLHCFDLEGHGLSPTSPLSKITIESFAADVNGVFEKANIAPDTGATIVAHSLGCLIAIQFALKYPNKVSKLVLLGPPPSPLPEAGRTATYARAVTVRTKGMPGIVDAVATAGTSEKSKTSVALAAVRMSLLSQDPEGYAKACTALAGADGLDFGAIQVETLIVTGKEDKTSPPQLCEKYAKEMNGKAKLHTLEDVGHWHVFEDVQSVAKAIESFL